MRSHDDMAYAELHRPVPKVVYEPLAPERDTRPSCEAVQPAPIRHFALCGFVLGVLVALYLIGGF